MSAVRTADAGQTLAHVLEALKSLVSGPKLKEATAFATRLFEHLPQDEFDERKAGEWAGLTLDLLRYFRHRPAHSAKVRVYNPTQDENGWESTHTAIQIVNDDMPFLVDTVSMAIAQDHTLTHLIMHPVFKVQRDPGGHILGFGAEDGEQSESIMHVEVDRQTEPGRIEALCERIERALADVRACVRDFTAMHHRALALAEGLSARELLHDPEYVAECADYLRWVADNHFTLLGYRAYETAQVDGTNVLRAVPGSGLGLLRGDESQLPVRPLATLAARDLPPDTLPDLIILSKTNARSTVHHPGYMDYIGVLRFDANGNAVGEDRFLGLYTSTAYTTRPKDIPLIRTKVDGVFQRSKLHRTGHAAKRLQHILETLPRDELFQSSIEELFETSVGILNLQERQRTRLFVRRDRFGRYFSCLVYIPRERFTSEIRERIEQSLKRAFNGERYDSSVAVSESVLARLHVVVRPKPGEKPDYDVREIEAKLAQIVRNWQDELRDILIQKHGEERGIKLSNRFGKALPMGYIEAVTPWIAAADVEAAAQLKDSQDVRLQLYRPRRKSDGALRFKVFKMGAPITLSDALPMLENMGLRVFSEHPYEMETPGMAIHIQDFEVEPLVPLGENLDQARERFQQGFEQIWRGRVENDGFNRLVLAAELEVREVAMLRGYCKYLLQTGVTYSQAYMERTLAAHPLVTRLLVEMFAARFDPDREQRSSADAARRRMEREFGVLLTDEMRSSLPTLAGTVLDSYIKPRSEQLQVLHQTLGALLEQVSSLDEDRILRAFRDCMRATLRTNHYQRVDGKAKDYISFKLDSSKVPGLPKPVPFREIFVYSPRVEGVHLRMGMVARGGLRWSDRREDFRTEVLGLMKAQQVKNTVIVPVGAKGGFYVKQPPAGNDRDAILAEGVACYRTFIRGLLDVTDNIVDGAIAPPERVVRHDPDDPYLVVAADKGTATFSDIANALSQEYGFWLDDGFASGGSKGYDHKKMGITAKGAWESVKRHFRAIGKDCQSEDFTCVGIGDMSGDVFGNGMLLSRKIRLLAAFDHRHIFVDPNPDAETSYVERERMFALPRSSWADYDTGLISAGGGVFPRSAKTITITPEMRLALGMDEGVEQLTPNELMRAILKAPAELLWNGGIGVYVKATTESHSECGDRSNNALRVNGRELRCRIVGEGGNLGLTQRGRIEFAQAGGLLNTDFIDNSAGVDTSDHEVNIKILLNTAIQQGQLTLEQRDELLVDMTDEVERLVLFDNYRQNLAISLMQALSIPRLGSKQHFVRTLEQQGLLDRGLEFLPTDAEFEDRKLKGQGLTRPELSILLSYSKIVLYQQLLDSDVPEDPYLSKELQIYFPTPLRERFSETMEKHRLRREIIATQVTNSIVNRMGSTFILRMTEDTGKSSGEIAKAFTIAREVVRAREWWAEMDQTTDAPERVNIDVTQGIWNLLRNLTRWLLQLPVTKLEIAASVERFAPGFEQLIAALDEVLPESYKLRYSEQENELVGHGYPKAMAQRISALGALNAAFDVIDLAHEQKVEVAEAARVYYDIGEALHLKWFQDSIESLPVQGRWHAHARGVLRDELYAQRRALAAQLLRGPAPKKGGRVQNWIDAADGSLAYTLGMFKEIRNQVSLDYPTISVAVRRLAQLVAAGKA
ncbi:MAG: NAD-glutamate dehydrogenase [Xanthomonadales bacterium]|nr:NAD-glutamate dehydrogenase [Xanthomonadales bacterium]